MIKGNLDTHDLSAIKNELESFWEKHVETSGIKCRVVRSTKEHTLKLLFKTSTEAMAVRKNVAWLRGSFHQARIEGKQWYPVKVDRANKLHLVFRTVQITMGTPN